MVGGLSTRFVYGSQNEQGAASYHLSSTRIAQGVSLCALCQNDSAGVELRFRCIVNERSDLGWIVDQYQVSVDKGSGIENDPNECAGPRYIFDLVRFIITVSVETMKAVDNLLHLSFESD